VNLVASKEAPHLPTVKNTPKTANKTARPSPRSGVALPVGNHPGNTGGKKGRSGRKPEAFTQFLTRLRESPELAASLMTAVSNPESRAFSSALKVLTDYDEDKPAKRKEVTGSDGGPIQIAHQSWQFGGRKIEF
jgi:hypothetical protein